VRHRDAHLLLVADVIRTSRITRTGSICQPVQGGQRGFSVTFLCLRENAVHRCGAERHSRSSGHDAAFLDGPRFWFVVSSSVGKLLLFPWRISCCAGLAGKHSKVQCL
jgi:hypothetical protein